MYEWVAMSHFNLAGGVASAEYRPLEEYEASVEALREAPIEGDSSQGGFDGRTRRFSPTKPLPPPYS